jgi:hypothetical protein
VPASRAPTLRTALAVRFSLALSVSESEADPFAVTASMLAAGAAAFGRNRFMRVGNTLHHARLMIALVGAHRRGALGYMWGPVERVMRTAETILQKGSTLALA